VINYRQFLVDETSAPVEGIAAWNMGTKNGERQRMMIASFFPSL
jgi:hypothetical protein